MALCWVYGCIFASFPLPLEVVIGKCCSRCFHQPHFCNYSKEEWLLEADARWFLLPRLIRFSVSCVFTFGRLFFDRHLLSPFSDSSLVSFHAYLFRKTPVIPPTIIILLSHPQCLSLQRRDIGSPSNHATHPQPI